MPGLSAIGMLGLSAMFGNRGGLGMAGIHGSIYVTEGSTAQGSVGTTVQKMTGFVSNGPYRGITPDHTDDSLEILSAACYLVLFQASFSGTNNATFHCHIYVNGVEQPFGFHRKLSAAGDVGSASIMGVLDLNAGDKITIGLSSDDGGDGDSFTPRDAQLIAARCG